MDIASKLSQYLALVQTLQMRRERYVPFGFAFLDCPFSFVQGMARDKQDKRRARPSAGADGELSAR